MIPGAQASIRYANENEVEVKVNLQMFCSGKLLVETGGLAGH